MERLGTQITAYEPAYGGYSFWWATTLLSFQSTVLFFPDESVPLLVLFLFASSISTSVLAHFTIAALLLNGFSLERFLARAPLAAGGCSLIGMALVAAASLAGDASVALVLSGGALIGAANASFNTCWGEVFGRLQPQSSSFWILTSVFLAIVLHFAVAGLSFFVPAAGPFACFALALAACVSLARATRPPLHDEAADDARPTDASALPVPHATEIAKTLWKPLVGCAVFGLVFSLSEQFATTGAAAVDFNSVHTFSLVGNALGAAVLLVIMFGMGKRLDLSTVGKVSIPLLILGCLILPAMLGITTIGANTLISTGCVIFDMMLACLLAETAFDYRASGAILAGIARGITIGVSGIGALVGWVLTTTFSSNTFALIAVALGTCYLAALAFSVSLSRKKMPRLSMETEEAQDESSELERSAQELADRKIGAIVDTYGLTRREAEVLEYLARGRTLAYISDELVVSPHTVRSHVRHIYEKTHVHSRQELLDLFELA